MTKVIMNVSPDFHSEECTARQVHSSGTLMGIQLNQNSDLTWTASQKAVSLSAEKCFESVMWHIQGVEWSLPVRELNFCHNSEKGFGFFSPPNLRDGHFSRPYSTSKQFHESSALHSAHLSWISNPAFFRK